MSARIISKVAATLAFLACAGCAPRAANNSATPDDPAIYRDRSTGCEYLARGNGHGGLTPRMDANGKQVCKAAPMKPLTLTESFDRFEYARRISYIMGVLIGARVPDEERVSIFAEGV